MIYLPKSILNLKKILIIKNINFKNNLKKFQKKFQLKYIVAGHIPLNIYTDKDINLMKKYDWEYKLVRKMLREGFSLKDINMQTPLEHSVWGSFFVPDHYHFLYNKEERFSYINEHFWFKINPKLGFLLRLNRMNRYFMAARDEVRVWEYMNPDRIGELENFPKRYKEVLLSDLLTDRYMDLYSGYDDAEKEAIQSRHRIVEKALNLTSTISTTSRRYHYTEAPRPPAYVLNLITEIYQDEEKFPEKFPEPYRTADTISMDMIRKYNYEDKHEFHVGAGYLGNYENPSQYQEYEVKPKESRSATQAVHNFKELQTNFEYVLNKIHFAMAQMAKDKSVFIENPTRANAEAISQHFFDTLANLAIYWGPSGWSDIQIKWIEHQYNIFEEKVGIFGIFLKSKVKDENKLLDQEQIKQICEYFDEAFAIFENIFEFYTLSYFNRVDEFSALPTSSLNIPELSIHHLNYAKKVMKLEHSNEILDYFVGLPYWTHISELGVQQNVSGAFNYESLPNEIAWKDVITELHGYQSAALVKHHLNLNQNLSLNQNTPFPPTSEQLLSKKPDINPVEVFLTLQYHNGWFGNPVHSIDVANYSDTFDVGEHTRTHSHIFSINQTPLMLQQYTFEKLIKNRYHLTQEQIENPNEKLQSYFDVLKEYWLPNVKLEKENFTKSGEKDCVPCRLLPPSKHYNDAPIYKKITPYDPNNLYIEERPPLYEGQVLFFDMMAAARYTTLAVHSWVEVYNKFFYTLYLPFFYKIPQLGRYSFILVFLCFALLLTIIMIVFSRFFIEQKGQKGDAEKRSAYECGFEPFEDARNSFDVNFYLVAILFILFDLEVIFLLPWALSRGFVSFIEVIGFYLFNIILTIGFIYEWKKGALEWY